MKKLVIFDLDNTLCDTIGSIPKSMKICFKYLWNYYPQISFESFIEKEEEVFQRLAVERKIPVYSMRALYWHEIFKELKIPTNPILIKELILLYTDQLAKNVELFDGILDLLNFLKNKNIKMAILSNGDYLTKASMMQYLNIINYFDAIVSSDMTQIDKPNPKAFEYVIDIFSISPKEALMVGDEKTNDIEGALNVGITPVYIKWTEKNKNRDTSNFDKRIIVCDNPRQIKDLIY